MSHRAFACVFAVLIAASPIRAGEAYDIRIKAPGVREAFRVEKEETRTTRTTVHDSIGRMVLDQKVKEVETFVYEQTVLEQTADGKPTVLRRRYDKAQLKNGKTSRNYAFHGRTVLIRQD